LDSDNKKLFFISQDFFFDITDGSDGPVINAFTNDYLRVSTVENNTGGITVYGVSNTVGAGITLDLTGGVIINWPDVFTSTATECFNNGTGTTGIEANDIGIAGTSKVIFIAFAFENIVDGADPNNKATLINRVMSY